MLAQELQQARESIQLMQQQQQAAQKRVTHRGTATDALAQHSDGVEHEHVAGTFQPRHDQAGRDALQQQRQEPLRRQDQDPLPSRYSRTQETSLC